MGSLEALNAVGADVLHDKVLLDLANPLDFSNGMPPSLNLVNTDSLGEQIQRAFPRLKVVKSLNTMNATLWLIPSCSRRSSCIFIRNDAEAKNVVRALLEEMGWTTQQFIDLGDITTARGLKCYYQFG